MSKKSKQIPNKIKLSKKDKIIAGVAGGVAEHYKLDPAIVRITIVILTAVLGIIPGILLYWVSYIIIKQQSQFLKGCSSDG